MAESGLPLNEISAEDDRRLVRAVASGSSDALAALYDRHAAVVYGLARRMMPQPEDAEEVVQDVFSQVWRQASRYQDERATVAGWLIMLTRTRAIDRIRARRARPDQARAVEPDLFPVVVSREPSPEDVAVSATQARSIRQSLAALPEEQRTLVALAYFDGLTHTEIARRTELPLGTVKTRIRAAMFALREAMRAEATL